MSALWNTVSLIAFARAWWTGIKSGLRTAWKVLLWIPGIVALVLLVTWPALAIHAIDTWITPLYQYSPLPAFSTLYLVSFTYWLLVVLPIIRGSKPLEDDDDEPRDVPLIESE